MNNIIPADKQKAIVDSLIEPIDDLADSFHGEKNKSGLSPCRRLNYVLKVIENKGEEK